MRQWRFSDTDAWRDTARLRLDSARLVAATRSSASTQGEKPHHNGAHPEKSGLVAFGWILQQPFGRCSYRTYQAKVSRTSIECKQTPKPILLTVTSAASGSLLLYVQVGHPYTIRKGRITLIVIDPMILCVGRIRNEPVRKAKVLIRTSRCPRRMKVRPISPRMAFPIAPGAQNQVNRTGFVIDHRRVILKRRRPHVRVVVAGNHDVDPILDKKGLHEKFHCHRLTLIDMSFEQCV
jgi:hypothetical protein